MHPLVWIGIISVIYATFEHISEQRRIRRLLEAVDKEWNECINRHHQAISEAYMERKPVHINMDRR
jgi:hypothetical protein